MPSTSLEELLVRNCIWYLRLDEFFFFVLHFRLNVRRNSSRLLYTFEQRHFGEGNGEDGAKYKF